MQTDTGAILPPGEGAALHYGRSAGRRPAQQDKDEKACIVKIANTSDKAQPVSVTFNGLKKSDKLVEGKCITLQSADLDKDNTVEHPNVITPKESDVTIEGNVLNVEMAPKTFVLYKFVKASNK